MAGRPEKFPTAKFHHEVLCGCRGCGRRVRFSASQITRSTRIRQLGYSVLRMDALRHHGSHRLKAQQPGSGRLIIEEKDPNSTLCRLHARRYCGSAWWNFNWNSGGTTSSAYPSSQCHHLCCLPVCPDVLATLIIRLTKVPWALLIEQGS